MRFVYFILLSALMFSLSACEPSHQQQKQALASDKTEKDIIPLKNGKADEVEGWLNDHTILYTASDPTKSELFAYDLFKGKAQKLYETEGQMVDVQINENRHMILLQITHNQRTAIVLLDQNGKKLYDKNYETYELEAAWNQYNPYQIMITVFTQDWDFDTYVVDAKKGHSKESPIQVPFIHWTSADTFEYIKNGKNNDSGPLYTYDLNTKREKKQLDDVLAIDSFQNMRLAVKSASDENGTFIFQWPGADSSVTYELPLQKKYSSLSPMEYDYDESGRLFYTFTQSGGAYKLIEVDLESKKKRDILDSAEMEPIQISPNGQFALYGYQFDRIISLKTHKVEPIITENVKGD
ncbi:hypothetical protein LWS67_15130 [Bacillus atrophaeus]|uniref:YqgU-like beta propeller domain-containing protein n=1 Tax=Bacillus atrophaeus TaxID=1452 RepID=UPI001EFA9FC8|nr:hypothetical protein [Bacillus atrophaeus]MCG8397855.1 hypothetical protein [Bacillus atrophaeus]